MATSKPKIDYDDEADVLYVSFGTDEPSYCEPLNSWLLLELGMFTNQPTGFRVIQPRKRNIKKIVVTVRKRITKELRQREKIVRKALEEVKKTKELEKVASVTPISAK